MTFPPTQPLASNHDRAAFSCGEEALDTFIKERARKEQAANVSVCWVQTHPGDSNHIIGYYTLSAYSIRVGDLPEEMQRKLPRYPEMPAALLGRLARHLEFRGTGLGERLLLDAMAKVLEHSRELGTLALVVDAKSEKVAAWYREYGFIPFPSTPLRLFIPVKTIARLFAAQA